MKQFDFYMCGNHWKTCKHCKSKKNRIVCSKAKWYDKLLHLDDCTQYLYEKEIEDEEKAYMKRYHPSRVSSM